MSEMVLQRWTERIQAARAAGRTLQIRGGDTREFYGEPRRLAADTDPVEGWIETRELQGVSSYEPSELVITARAGTLLSDLEALLAQHGQCLAFEPPRFGPASTVGGMVAAGLSGPARASVGCVRDFVLGTSLLNGRGELMRFGGQVMKNVAGYDISRVLAGSLGVLGVICEVSLKVLPNAPATATLRFDLEQARALEALHRWAGEGLPLSASAWWSGTLVLRLSGAEAAVASAARRLGGERIEPALAQRFWSELRDHSDDFFRAADQAIAAGHATLWRLSVPPTAAPLDLAGEQLIEWGGGQRWLLTPESVERVRWVAAEAGGHATIFQALDRRAASAGQGVFTPLTPALERIHRQLKLAFDPDRVFNPGRLYPDL